MNVCFLINTDMRLYEITNTLTPDKFTPGKIASVGDSGFKMDNQEMLGSGLFARAFSTPQEPGTVRKVVGPISEDEFGKDAYFRYLKLLAKNERFITNPYFPRIFDLQVKRFESRYAYAVDMERLHDYNDLSDKEARMLADRMFHRFEHVAARQIQQTMSMGEAIMEFISDLLDNFYPAKQATVYKDPELRKAVLLLRKLKTTGDGIFFDIHDGNFMIRRGPYGPHIVFTDPVAA